MNNDNAWRLYRALKAAVAELKESMPYSPWAEEWPLWDCGDCERVDVDERGDHPDCTMCRVANEAWSALRAVEREREEEAERAAAKPRVVVHCKACGDSLPVVGGKRPPFYSVCYPCLSKLTGQEAGPEPGPYEPEPRRVHRLGKEQS